ncbi:hypothetical protein [Pedobacter chitinilyticus]|uniref:Uncharacterized protein n=1 Tax=Pedobacter chitinilyticus TaxID=2233776 RepID=A0A3S3SS94_9SPHI|nr:hypothetical protein [Pedobacter chitinilyticus]RWU08189.1 hypothetical protein DPV69_07345 [Pedobacter chitinilyticus]
MLIPTFFAKLIRDFDELGFTLSLMEKINLKQELAYFDNRRTFFALQGKIDGTDFEATFFIVRPKHENFFAIRHYQFKLKSEGTQKCQVFKVNYLENDWFPVKLKGPISKIMAYNLLSGRAVFNDESKAWLQIDFSKRCSELSPAELNSGDYLINADRFDQLHDNFVMRKYADFDLKKELTALGIDNVDDVEKRLRNGDVVKIQDDRQKLSMMVSPKFRYIRKTVVQPHRISLGDGASFKNRIRKRRKK